MSAAQNAPAPEHADAYKSPEINDRLRTMQMEPVGSTRREAEQFFASETEYWGRIVKDANVTLE